MRALKNISTVVFPLRLWSFITSTLKSLTIHAIWLALSSVIYSQIAPFFRICSKSHHSCSKSYHFCFKSHHFFLYRNISVSNTKWDVKAILILRFQNGCNKVVIELRVVLFWSEISNRAFWNCGYDFRLNCTPLSSITIINHPKFFDGASKEISFFSF